MTAVCQLDATATTAKVLRQEIAEVCVRIDRRLGNRRGTAERGLWFWLWPPHPDTSRDVLDRMYADALTFLTAIEGDPA